MHHIVFKVFNVFIDRACKRIIRSVKTSLYAIIVSNALRDDNFNTMLCEIAQFMNKRPITTVSSSPCDISFFEEFLPACLAEIIQAINLI